MTHLQQASYQININGELDPDWSDWLNGFEVSTQVGADGTCITIIRGVVLDQAALRSVLNKIWDLNLELDSVYRSHEPPYQDSLDNPLPPERSK